MGLKHKTNKLLHGANNRTIDLEKRMMAETGRGSYYKGSKVTTD